MKLSFVDCLRSIVVLVISVGVAQGMTVLNGDFEADAGLFPEWPGYTGAGANPAQISSWVKEGGGNVGINPSGPDGHANPTPFDDPSTVNPTTFAFIQNEASLSQEITGFSVGGNYMVSLDFNARACCGDPVGMPSATVSLDDTVIASSVDLFGGIGAISPTAADASWYHADIPFTAATETLTLKIAGAPAVGGDATLVLDNISIAAAPIPEPSVSVLAMLGASLVLIRRRRAS